MKHKHSRLAGFNLNVKINISIACDVALHLSDSSVFVPEFSPQHFPPLSHETPFFSTQIHPALYRAMPVYTTQTTATLPRSERCCESWPQVRFSEADSCHGTQCGLTQVHMKRHISTQKSHGTLPRDHSDTTQFHITKPLDTFEHSNLSSNAPFFHCSPNIAAPLFYTAPPPGYPLH